MPTYQELRAKMALLQEQVEAARLAERGKVLTQVRELVESYALTESEVFSRRRITAPTRKVPPKYRNPETGETWTGRGRAPVWIDNTDRDRFLIQTEAPKT
ncbi:H-NS histone family protein [Burkholderia seminalis]|uniref:H-NS histone family protein n=2 Tax=Burkholderia seminalis TaxID=488731 RepID=UPI001583593B|nr:H-NS histone family protein [Burkholderia seminalis]MCA8306778.1 H-NS histone family protein [Burkholderia seminalis]MCA8435252.1 H-NS histone family protein [Burkholderia seminalis]